MRTGLFISLILISLFPTFSQDTLSIKSLEVLEVNEYCKVFSVSSERDVQEVLSSIRADKLMPLADHTNQGMAGDESYWVLFSIQNNTNSDSKYLEILNPQIDFLELFAVTQDSARLIHRTGDQFVFNQRPIPNRNFVLPIKLSKGESHTYLLHVVKKLSAVDFPMIIYDESHYSSKVSVDGIFFGLYFGILFLVSLISFVVGLVLRQKVFIIYGLYVFSFGMWFFSKEGFSYQFITSNYPLFNTHFYPLWTSNTSLLLILYIQSFFNTKELLPTFNKIMSVMVMVFVVGTIIWAIFPQQYMEQAPKLFALRYLILLLTIVFAYTSAIKSLKISPWRARLFLFGYSVFFVGILSELANEYGLMQLHGLIIPPIMLGYLIEVFALTLAMGSIILNVMKQRDELLVSNQGLQEAIETIAAKNDQKEADFITLKSKAVLYHEDIRYIQSDDHYVEFFLVDRDNPEVDRNSISKIREMLPTQFSQIHRSTIVNLRHVKSIYSDKVQLRGGEELRLSRTFKKAIETKLKS